MELNNNTPIEKYKIHKIPVWVKREDLCTPVPGPPFSKVRGLYTYMRELKGRGCKVVGYTESSISMAGWGVAWVAKQLNMKAVIFDPIYKHNTPALLSIHRWKWKELGAITVPIQAGRTSVNNYIANKRFYDQYPNDSMMLPIGLRLADTVNETALEWKRTREQWEGVNGRPFGTIVVCVGSGTICAGLLKGTIGSNIDIIGIMAYSGSLVKKRKEICAKAHGPEGLFFSPYNLVLFKSEYQYTEEAETDCPFPCHPYYDLKAWEWLQNSITYLDMPVLFWNIGSEAK